MTAPGPLHDVVEPTTPSRRDPAASLPRTALRFGFVVAGIVLLIMVLVAGCGSAPLPAAAPSTAPPPPAPTTSATSPSPTPSEPSTSGSGGTTGPTGDTTSPEHRTTPDTRRGSVPHPEGAPRAAGPLWPVRDAAAAANLQREVDGGRQPWLLDPVEVAISYAGVELGYRNPGVFPIRPGVVELRDGRSPGRATVTLAQTVRRGDGGIWLVTDVQRR